MNRLRRWMGRRRLLRCILPSCLRRQTQEPEEAETEGERRGEAETEGERRGEAETEGEWEEGGSPRSDSTESVSSIHFSLPEASPWIQGPESGPMSQGPESDAGSQGPESGPGSHGPESGPGSQGPDAGPGGQGPDAGSGSQGIQHLLDFWRRREEEAQVSWSPPAGRAQRRGGTPTNAEGDATREREVSISLFTHFPV